MQKILMLTNTVDGTADILVDKLDSMKIKVFRWNIDLWQKYKILFNDYGFKIIDPNGYEITSSEKPTLLWRKPFVDLMSFEGLELVDTDITFAKVQVRQLLNSIVAMVNDYKGVKLIDPQAELRLPKLYQLQIAQNFFNTLPFEFSFHTSNEYIADKYITKPLGNPALGSKIMYTVRVEPSELFRPYPWLLQKAITGGTDVTCVYINGESHFFECDYKRSDKSIDWRTEINTEGQAKWHPLVNDKLTELKKSTFNLMEKFKLHYGRLDFIREGNNFFFLECNPNGQFGW
ncbi:MAG: hypothetical protein WCH62_07360, partial [Candidatus Omnitrophota bacterium]